MTILIKRNLAEGEVTEGKLYIDDFFICDTLENTHSCLPVGSYPICIMTCTQYRRNIISVKSSVDEAAQTNQCHKCKLKELVFSNTPMPRFCPQIKPGNGVYGRRDGSIILGSYLAPGIVRKSRQAFDALYERIRKNIERGKCVSLKIR